MTSRLERVIQVLLLLQSGVPYNALQIAERMGVHRRTIFRDVALLRSLGVPISYDMETARYSLPRDLPKEPAEVSIEELTDLLMAACLTVLPEGRTANMARRAIEKLSERIPAASRRELGRVVRSYLPADSTRHDSQLVELLLQSIRKGLALEMEVCQPGNICNETIQVAPLRLSYLDSGWLVYAYIFPEGPAREIELTSVRHALLTDSPYSAGTLGQAFRDSYSLASLTPNSGGRVGVE